MENIRMVMPRSPVPFFAHLLRIQAELHRPLHCGKSSIRLSDGMLPYDPGQQTGGRSSCSESESRRSLYLTEQVPDRDTFTRSNCPLWHNPLFQPQEVFSVLKSQTKRWYSFPEAGKAFYWKKFPEKHFRL